MSAGTLVREVEVGGLDWSVAALVAEQVAAAAYYARQARERGGGCACSRCCSVDAMPSMRLRSVSPLAEHVARRLEVLG